MRLQQKIHFEAGLLTVEATGEFSLDEAKRAFVEMLSAVAQFRAKHVLLDGRTVKGEPGDLERFYYGEVAAQETRRLIDEFEIAPQFAYVIHEPLRDPQRFGETVAVNRGMNIKVFGTPEEAFAWLGRTSARKTETGDAS